MTNDKLKRLGFSHTRTSAHMSRTMMFDELDSLFVCVPAAHELNDYAKAIIDDNCLGKRSIRTRILALKHLGELYSLDPNLNIFKTLLFFWNRDVEGRPLLALLCAISRDELLHKSVKYIIGLSEGQIISRDLMEEFIEESEAGRFSKASLRSIAQNINSSWTQSGHLKGKVNKCRTKVKATTSAVAYSLYLGYLCGIRGPELFETDYVKLMDCTREKAVEFADIASQKGWIVFRHIGNVMELLFPNLVTKEEAEWLNE